MNDIIDAVSIKLNAAFGGEYRIYKDDVRQGLTEPCFFIAFLNASNKRMLNPRAYRAHPFDIHYFPKEDGNNGELFDVADKLFTVLEMIELRDGDLLRGTDMSYETVDGILHFFVSYNMYVTQTSEIDTMEILNLETNI